MVPLESALSTSFPITSAMPAPNFMSFTHPDSASSQISLDDMLTGLLPEVLPLADLNISSNSHSSPEMRKCPVCNRNYRNSTRLAVHILEVYLLFYFIFYQYFRYTLVRRSVLSPVRVARLDFIEVGP